MVSGKVYKGDVIMGLETVAGSIVFHAGTASKEEQTVINGGRVMAVISFGNTMDITLQKSFANAEHIQYKGKYYLRDIGNDLREYYKD
jgi:phosphoribosylamine--glycine ligase